ncbi:DEAD/DEAH box helicase family protein [Aquihabitans sp. G128]|uniref:DEAD/DEAH box helicase family protein n=1 Tax=Aquihabitans sp. G128 TaxID=2849779 RepID=UPI001C24AF00|nr:DEAD/DEAH box helicase family protein [Aquihabitans sp. G128]QXC60619.1 DEAD/DEAH box helicase family protein [Aquihabitans sp. G128]
MFDPADLSVAEERAELRTLLGDEAAWSAARRTTLNAHYTSAPVIQAMWGAARDLGFTGGRVLEPGCGSGNFIGLAPEDADIVGVELDPTTASIARHLYASRSQIHTGGFETYSAPPATFDLAIGNVPFAKITPYDPSLNRAGHALHNYFLLKSLHLVRPGGLVLALTSRYTLDSRSDSARRAIADSADLVGALRLPAGAFKSSSGTDVVCDLLVLRRRLEGEPRGDQSWLGTTDLAGTAPQADSPRVNQLFVDRPDFVLGELTTTRGMYRDNEITVTPTGPLEDQFHIGLRSIAHHARAKGLVFVPRDRPGPGRGDAAARPVEAGAYINDFAQESSLVRSRSGGSIGRMVDGNIESFSPRVKKDRAELLALIELRDATRNVLATQTSGGDDLDLAEAQQALRERYAGYLDRWGPINRYGTARTGRTDPETGHEVTRRLRPRMGGFRDDPDWPLVAALEVFDDETQRAEPAPIFTKRVVAPPADRHRVETPAEAIAVSLDELGRVDLGRIAALLHLAGPAEAQEAVHELTFGDPTTGEPVTAARYLSGDVRSKLRIAEEAAAVDDAFDRNVRALRSALPEQLEPEAITARPGATWIPAGDIEDFCAEVLASEVLVEHLPDLASWTLSLRSGGRAGVSLSSEWGTARADAVTLLDAALNQRLHNVTDPTEDGRRIRNDAETLAARDKQAALSDRFSDWVWEDEDRSGRLCDRYNELFCSVRLPTHDGSHLTLPGLADTFVPHDHQRDAVARVLADGRALLAHAVGAGKTATMVMAATELRRLGMATKPAVVVPNHMLEQFCREWLQLYPTARILVADRDRLSKERRKEFVARCATGEWDGIVFTHAGFARLPLAHDQLCAYLAEQLGRARAALTVSASGKALSVKKLERRIAQLEATYEQLLAERNHDDGITFDETGIDYLFCDEAHAYKNLRVDSSIDGVATKGSRRAQDLDAKLWALRRRHGSRVATFATATPVANSMAELWVMQSYLQPDVLESAGLRAFDAWAATFGRTHTALELAPDGASYRMQTRFARFQNVPELLGLYRQVADVRTSEDLGLPVPTLADGKVQTVVVQPADALIDYVADLASRAERIRSRAVDPAEDNMLKVTGDGRRAALDLHLVGLEDDACDAGKIATAANHIARIHHATRHLTYLDDLGEEAVRSGALQLVFCDVSTPAAAGWNAYHELRTHLADRGVDPATVRFIQEAPNDQAKARLFAGCRDGSVAVLVGSTETMGVGTNVQARAVALHHLDCPWRPADIEQREGRILRQGNQNPEVQVLRYVTEGSFDTYMWQTLERKAAFIAQVTRGDLPDRDIDDIGDLALTYAEVKALATGDPLILEKASVDAEVSKLMRLERAPG